MGMVEDAYHIAHGKNKGDRFMNEAWFSKENT